MLKLVVVSTVCIIILVWFFAFLIQDLKSTRAIKKQEELVRDLELKLEAMAKSDEAAYRAQKEGK